MNIRRTVVYSPYVSISVGEVPRVQSQQPLSSWSSLYLWEWVCLQVETCLPNSVVDTDFQETSVWCPCLRSFLSFSSLLPTPLHLVRRPSALPNPWSQPLCCLFSESLPKPLQSTGAFLSLSNQDTIVFICSSHFEP